MTEEGIILEEINFFDGGWKFLPLNLHDGLIFKHKKWVGVWNDNTNTLLIRSDIPLVEFSKLHEQYFSEYTTITKNDMSDFTLNSLSHKEG